MYKIVLIRHGQTTYNRDKIFCGWTDVDLTEKGISEAKIAGINLKNAGFTFDVAFTSLLKRAKNTLDITLKEMNIKELPINYSWRLNERHYGALQDQKHSDISAKHSPEQVHIWRRSFKDRPPELDKNDVRHPLNDQKYSHIDKADLPSCESLADTINRVLPYWYDEIVPNIKNNKKVIISASGNSLRSLIKYIDNISDDDIVSLEILNGTPLVYELDKNLKTIKKYYLLDGGIENIL